MERHPVERRGRGKPPTLVGRVREMGSLGDEAASRRATPELSRGARRPVRPHERARRRVCPEPAAQPEGSPERAEAPPPAGAGGATANKAPLRVSRPPPSGRPRPQAGTPSPPPPPRQSAPCVPHRAPASQAPGNLGGGGGVQGAGPGLPTGYPPTRGPVRRCPHPP